MFFFCFTQEKDEFKKRHWSFILFFDFEQTEYVTVCITRLVWGILLRLWANPVIRSHQIIEPG